MLTDVVVFILILAGVAVMAILLNKRLLTLLLSGIFLLLVAVRLNVTNMYLMGTVLLALPAASYAVGWYGGRRMEVKRSAPEAAFEQEPVAVRIDVTSPASLFPPFTHVAKRLPPHLEMVDGSERIEAVTGGVRHEYQLRADRRGVYEVGGCTVCLQDPLGIFTLRHQVPQSKTLTVYPTGLAAHEALSMGGSSGGWLLLHTIPQRGEEEGFYGTREYRVGDDLRRIHWRSSARQGGLVVVERERAASGRVWLALDVRQGSDRGNDAGSTLERAIKTAVSVMEATLARGEAVGLLAKCPSGGTVTPDTGDGQRWRILDILARVQADGTEPFEQCVLQTPIGAGSTVVLLTGAPTNALTDTISVLRRAGVAVVAVPIEAQAPVSAGAYAAMEAGEFAQAAAACGAAVLRSLASAAGEPPHSRT